MSKLIKYPAGRYEIFRGKTDSLRWYIYDTIDGRYVGGSHETMRSAKAWVEANGK